MRVTIAVSAFYDWAPVPADVEVTPKDIASGRVKPNRSGQGFDMRLTRKKDTHTDIAIAESTIIARIIHELMPQNGGRSLSRKEAVANLLAINVMPHHAHPKFFKGIVVDIDDGPDEEQFRASLDPYTKAIHQTSGYPLVDPEEVESIVKKYMEGADAKAHQDHLCAHFNVKKPAASAEAVSK